MSDKRWNLLNVLDQQLRRTFPEGDSDSAQGTRVIIELFSGFELFNTRPYHNYETFSSGYRVKLPDGTLTVEREDLDDAVREFCLKIAERKEAAKQDGKP